MALRTLRDGPRSLVLASLRDVTLREESARALRAAESALRDSRDRLAQAGRSQTLVELAAGIAHEVNQPLAAIRSYADNAGVLLDHQRLDDARGNLKQISELTGRMASIIAHLRAFARRDRHAPESVALQPATAVL